MADWIFRTLRDGGLEGEHAPSLTINDTISCPLGSFVFYHIVSQLYSFISSQKSNSNGVVLVAFSRSPLYYEQLLKRKVYDVASSGAWFRILDCYTDPLGWKTKLVGSIRNLSSGSSLAVNLCTHAKDMHELLSSVLQLGKELSGDGKRRFVVAIDSVSEMLRHTPVSQVAAFISNLRSHDEIASLFWLLHSDLHETRATAAVEYMSSMKATIKQLVDGPKGNSENVTVMEHNLRRGKFCVHAKCRNGRVRMMFEELSVEKSGIKFTHVSSEDEMTVQSFVPKVQFNLQLSEKERNDRAKVVLPFEHQGDGRTIEIYDGRKSINDDVKAESQPTPVQNSESNNRGEIIYFRDSDDEMPDSDEDPDDDLDI